VHDDETPTVTFEVDGAIRRAPNGTTVAAALMNAGLWGFRRSVRGDERGPLCAMGICHECRVIIDGTPHRRACLILLVDGMVVRTASEGGS
jgi:aerobic-type carbon monoxide dehydrogenase small subunit (CoxS/CutS family)